jgi:hypothetical protein
MDNKKICISGTNNRYMMKKATKEPVVDKKRVGNIDLKFVNQLDLISGQMNPTIEQQINRKISGYKQQDLKKGVYDDQQFINIDSLVNKMRETELKCYYCKVEMMIFYETVREAKQWTVDRIDNDVGHNMDNYHLACLSCNLKRRRTDDDKFLFTKQLSIVKTE